MVEAAIVFPVFFLLIMAIFEFGLAFRSYLTVGDATQAAVRTASTLGDQSDTDYRILQTVNKTLANIPDSDILDIVVFKAADRNARVGTGDLAACATGSVAGLCNHYTGSDMTRPATDFTCTGAAPDTAWCPSDRNTNQSDPPDLVGVYVRARQNSAAGTLGNRTVTQHSILRIEPDRA